MNPSPLSLVRRLFAGSETATYAAPGRKRYLRAVAMAGRLDALESRLLLSSYALTTFGSFDGSNGSLPNSRLTLDNAGNLWGTTSDADTANHGTVYKIAAGSSIITIVDHFDGNNGDTPEAGVTFDSAGNLWGTAVYGGTDNKGTLYMIAALSSTITRVASFGQDIDSYLPNYDLTLDSAGNLWGAGAGGALGQGVVYKIAAGSSTATTVASFDGLFGITGAGPSGGLTLDSAGNLWGTTSSGNGTGNYFGTVYKIAAGSGTITTVANFTGTGGLFPRTGVIVDSLGNVWGTTQDWGANDGTVYKIAAGSSTITTVATFKGSNGKTPTGLTLDSAGNLWGTTTFGGTANKGTVFKIAAGSSTITTVATFKGSNGAYPEAGLTIDSAGNLWGTTFNGGKANKGTVFRISPASTAKLVFKQQPGTTINQQPQTTIAGHVIAPAVTVYIEDSSGKLTTLDNSTVTLSISKGPADAALGGTLTVPVINGIATFSDLSLTKAGSYTLLATDGALKAATSKSFTVTPDNSTAHLVLSQQPAATLVGKPLSPSLTVSVQDQYGNVITTDKSKITLSIINGPLGGTFGGTTTVTASKGIAIFSKAFLKLAGNYTLSATDGTSPIATPLQFTQTITQGVTSVTAPKPAASYKLGKTINLSTTLKSTTPLTIPFTGTATILDQSDAVLGTATVSASGKISFALSNLLAGSFTSRIHYAGDDNHTAIDSPTFSLVVV